MPEPPLGVAVIVVGCPASIVEEEGDTLTTGTSTWTVITFHTGSTPASYMPLPLKSTTRTYVPGDASVYTRVVGILPEPSVVMVDEAPLTLLGKAAPLVNVPAGTRYML